MNKTTMLLLLILTLILTACGSSASSSTGPASGPTGAAAAGELPATTQLIIGTLKLEDTDQAVTKEQAAELLPLWQTLQGLQNSDTAATQEIEALIEQIQETMNAEQMQAITAMNLSREDMLSIMQDQGMGMGGPQGGITQRGETTNNGGGFGPGGGGEPGEGMPMPPDGGGFQDGGPGFGSGQGQNLSADQIATAQAARQAGETNRIPPMLINALIQFLQEKAAS